ncbi:MAG: non-hydrolyzing UDP-N-acetylglucosamine 2-epimerase [Christensenellales bacterium]
MKKVMVAFGTRPEAIKMCPLVKELRSRLRFQTLVLVSGQHKEMLRQVLDIFDIKPDYDLAVMRERQTLMSLTSAILDQIGSVLTTESPDIVLVHGDTTTAFVTALACFYQGIPVGHVEAGLRTYDITSPMPEEFNRQAISLIARLHFAPTEGARENLLHEGKDSASIFVTGNTAIDAFKTTIRTDFQSEHLSWAADSRLVLLTAHRRENLGGPMDGMFRAIRRIVDEHSDVKVIYPVHPNPLVRGIAEKHFAACDRIRLIEPLDVVDFHNLLARCYIVLTDSGGIQEEAPSLGIPVLVMRNTTERPEGMAAGTARLVGTDETSIYDQFGELLCDEVLHRQMAQSVNPYGDGQACKYIVDALENMKG